MTSAAVTWRRGAPAWAAPATATAALAAATVYTAVRDPHQAGFFPSCLFYATSGYYCPGCGGLRAVHDLLHGDVVGALHMNPVVVLLVIPAVAALIAWWFASRVSTRVRPVTIPTWLAIAIPVFLGVFWVVRNLPPLAPYLSPVGG